MPKNTTLPTVKATKPTVPKTQPWRAMLTPKDVRSYKPTCGDTNPDIRLQMQRDEHGGMGG